MLKRSVELYVVESILLLLSLLHSLHEYLAESYSSSFSGGRSFCGFRLQRRSLYGTLAIASAFFDDQLQLDAPMEKNIRR